MPVAGLLTLTMAQAVFAPKATFASMFGEGLESPAATIVVRNWGFLICASALFLLYAAFVDVSMRAPALIISGTGKVFFALLVFGSGGRYTKTRALTAAIIDSAFAALFAVYLFATA
ncbi:MAG: hypothetical protein AB7J28_07720 [Hyphomonadaceae bacterium]